MRTNGSNLSMNDLHFHNGGTCHGSPTLEACIEYARQRKWVGKILERTDTYEDGTVVKCYSLICGHYDHYAKQGKFVADLTNEIQVKHLY